MRRFTFFLVLAGLLTLSCQALALPGASPTLAPATSTPSPSTTPVPTFTATATATPLPPTFTPTATATSLPVITPQRPVFEIRPHPDGGLYVGDLISLEILAPPGFDPNDQTLSVILPEQAEPVSAGFSSFGIGQRSQATLQWAWDTSSLAAAEYPLVFSVQPVGITWTYSLTLSAASQLPAPEPQADWATANNDCCIVHYVTQTAAERDLAILLDLLDRQATQTVERLGVEFTDPIEINLLPRVLGHGGFASSEVSISYLDRNYVGNDLSMVAHHEMVHILDARLGGELRPSLLVEGLAVYLTGGHYKPEELLPRAAALLNPQERADGLGLGWYLPLIPLSNEFYTSQHEIGYIQAGALVEFMVDNWGWQAFSDFYRDIHPAPGGLQSEALEAALQAHFGVTFAGLEASFLAELRQQPVTQALIDDVRLTVACYDTIRRYQQALDPSAYFLTAWLPDAAAMRQLGLVTDFLRRPAEVENLALEVLLVAVDTDLDSGDYAGAERSLSAANAVLTAIERGQQEPLAADPLAAVFGAITEQLLARGYAVTRLEVLGSQAWAEATQGTPTLAAFEFVLQGEDWLLVSSNQ